MHSRLRQDLRRRRMRRRVDGSEMGWNENGDGKEGMLREGKRNERERERLRNATREKEESSGGVNFYTEVSVGRTSGNSHRESRDEDRDGNLVTSDFAVCIEWFHDQVSSVCV